MENLKANPQAEHGYTKIANELLDALIKYPFNGSELRILLAVIRNTYGWKKTKDVIPFSQLSKCTHIDLRYIKRLIKRLVKDNVLFKEQSPRGNILGLNKNYYSWKLWINQGSNNKIDTGVVANMTPEEVVDFTPKVVA
ncbi:MAG: replication protein [Candidatus Omnitrophota bacterium]